MGAGARTHPERVLVAAQGVQPCSLLVAGPGSSSDGPSKGGGALVIVDSTGAALFSTERVLASQIGSVYSAAPLAAAVYDVAAGSWSAAAQPSNAVEAFAQTRLLTGEVLQACFTLFLNLASVTKKKAETQLTILIGLNWWSEPCLPGRSCRQRLPCSKTQTLRAETLKNPHDHAHEAQQVELTFMACRREALADCPRSSLPAPRCWRPPASFRPPR